MPIAATLSWDRRTSLLSRARSSDAKSRSPSRNEMRTRPLSVAATKSLPTGVAKGVGLSREELREMVNGYYEARQWDENGFVPQQKLDQLEITRA